MDIEIKYISLFPLSMRVLGFSIVEMCQENNWKIEISDKWKNGIQSGDYQFEISTGNTLFVAAIIDESYRKTWFIENEKDYHKSHLGTDCFYVLKVLYLKSENDSIDFLTEFSIKFLEKYPDVIVETLEFDALTGMKEYTLTDLYQIQENNYRNNWSAINEGPKNN